MDARSKDVSAEFLAFTAAVRRIGSSALLVLAAFLGACGEDSEPEAPAGPVGTGIGERAPDLIGILPDGGSYGLMSELGSPTVVVFYHSIQCGLCRVQLEQMQTNLAAYDRAGADLVAVSLDPPEFSQQSLEQADLGFPVVAVDSATFAEWGALSEDRSSALPATYVIDSAGVVRFRHIGRNASDRTTDAEIVAVLQEIRPT